MSPKGGPLKLGHMAFKLGLDLGHVVKLSYLYTS